MKQLQERLFEIIKTLPYDLRAEVVLADLIEKGLNQDVLLVSAKGLFKRRFSRDIEQISALELGKKQKFVKADINREGIYDALPQAITHSTRRGKKTGLKAGNDMVPEIRERRKEEAAARNFFLPFENEFYHQCIELEIAERNILKGFISNSRYNKLMNEFWQLPAILNERQKATFIYLLPIVYKAAGNLALTKTCYEAILSVPVNFTIKNSVEQTDANLGYSQAEGPSLGTNFVCGSKFYSHNTWYEIQLGPVNEAQLQDYLPGSNGAGVINYLNSYYLPFDVETKLNILTEPALNDFILNNQGNRLAYTTCL